MGKNNRVIKHDRLPIVYNPVTRRMFLRGLGGAFIAMPFMSSLIPRVAVAATEQDFRKLAFFVFRYGVHWYDWEPRNVNYTQVASNVRTGSLAQSQMGRMFTSDYDSLRPKMSVLLGLDALNNGGHIYASALAASCHPDDRNEVFSRTQDSIDEILANSSKVYPNGSPVRVLRMDGYGDGSFTHCFRNGSTIRVLNNSRSAFDLVRSSIVIEPSSPVAISESELHEARNKATVDRALAAANQTKQSRSLSSEENIIFSNYMDMLAEISKNINSNGAAAPTGGSPAICENAQYENDQGDIHGRARNMVDTMILGMACGVTKLAYMKLNSNHNTAHPIDSDNGRTNHINTARQLSLPMPIYAMQKMDSIVEANGKTLLENSAVVTTSDEGSSKFDNHVLASMPVLVGGSLNGALRMGEVVDFRNYQAPLVIRAQAGLAQGLRGGRAYNEFLISLMRSFGLNQQDYYYNGQAGYGIYQNSANSEGVRAVNDYFRNVYLAENGNNLDQPLPYYYRG
jgi:hypothetical protein